MNPNSRQPAPTSWVQLSASGATSLATSSVGAAGHARRAPLQATGHSSSSSSSSAASIVGPASRANEQHQQHHHHLHHQQFPNEQQFQEPLASRSSFISNASAVSSSNFSPAHQQQFSKSLIMNRPRAATTSSSSTASSPASSSSGPSSLIAPSVTSGGGGGGQVAASSSPSQQQLAMGANLFAASSQQLQLAMGELQLAEQQLGLNLGFGSAAAAPNHPDGDKNNNNNDQDERQQEQSRKLRRQLYVFVLRCISYPFNAKQTPSDPRQQMLKLRKQQYEQIVQLHTKYVRQLAAAATTNADRQPDKTTTMTPASEQVASSQQLSSGAASSPSSACYQHMKLTQSQVKELEELNGRLHVLFNRRFLQNERMRVLVESECCSQADLRDLFRIQAKKILKESQLYIGAQQQQSRSQTAASRAGLAQAAGCGELPSAQAAAQLAQNEQSLGAARSPPLPPSWSQLLANREAILNNWLIRFESIIRDESGSGSPLADCSTTTTIAANKQAADLALRDSSSGGVSTSTAAAAAAATTTAAPGAHLAGAKLSNAGLQQQQQQQQSMTKEQLYQMFQNILNVKKFEHQLLYNALQLDSSDEQAAAIRRELDGRVARIAELERNKKLLPKFVLKEMESLYLEESRMAVNKLMVNLDSLPVLKGGGGLGGGGLGGGALGATSSGSGGTESRVYSGLQKFRRYNSSRAQATLTRDGLAETHPSEPQLSKLDVVLTFNIEVIVMEVRGLKSLVAPSREIYCTMEIEASETGRLQTEHVQAKKPLWDTQGDFTTNHPLPVLKIKLYAVNPSMLSLEDKELGKLVLRPTVLSPKTPEWCVMQPSGAAQDKLQLAGHDGGHASMSMSMSSALQHQHHDDELKIRVIVRMDRPQQLKHCGFLLGVGKSTWRKFKRRYHILIQVSQYTFVMCAYREKKAKPTEMLQLDGYTVDYIEPPTDLIMDHCSEISTSGGDSSAWLAHHNTNTGSLAQLPPGAASCASSGSSLSSSGAFGLAGRLAKPFLKQAGASGASASAAASSSGDNPSASTGGGGGASGASDLADDAHPEHHQQQQQQQPSAIQSAAALSDELHNKFYFNVVKEGDSVVFACDDQQDCHGWVMALYRATGQAHKPTPLRQQGSGATHYVDAAFAYQAAASGRETTKLVGNSQPSCQQSGAGGAGGGLSLINGSGGGGGGAGAGQLGGASGGAGGGSSAGRSTVDMADQRARKHGMDEFISAEPCKFNHNQLFRQLQDETLGYRLNDQYCSFGWLTAGQLFVLDEYCARYGVRTCYRHLAYLNSLLDFNARGLFIDHTLLNINYDFCASLVSGQIAGLAGGQLNPMSSVMFDLKPDGIGTVTVEERDLFHVAKGKLLKMIERQISNFDYCFPFGRPAGSLKAALSLLERVHMKEHQASSMVQNEEVRSLIRKCLDQAALNNYTRLSGQANLLGGAPPTTTTTSTSSTSPDQGGPAVASTPNGGQHQMGPTSAHHEQEQLFLAAGEHHHQPTQVFSPTLDSLFGRKRTQSNLSGSSVVSRSSFSASNHPNNTTNLSDSTRRRQLQQKSFNQANQQQQEQCLTMAKIIANDQFRPIDKLLYLIRLAELCCEQVEENNEYFGDAFAWHSDLLMDHFELFWSLFSVDMDKILGELAAAASSSSTAGGNNNNNHQSSAQQQQQQQQFALDANRRNSQSSSPAAPRSAFGALVGGGPAAAAAPSLGGGGDLLGTSHREQFALFQVLNNHMRKSPNFECKKFKSHLCDTFRPKLVRYIDVMESILTRMVLKACEREGQVNCLLIEQMFFKLDELQKFVLVQLRWPDEQLAEQLLQRLKLMAYELCDASVQQTQLAFQQLERKSNKWTATTTTYNSPEEMISMINFTLDARNRSLKLCTFNGYDQMSYHSKIDKLIESALAEMQPGLMAKMLNALDSTLTKLARYDEGNLLAPILSLTYKQGMFSSGKDIGKQYVSFVSNCCDLLRHKINDELWIVNLLEDWYAVQMGTICNWLAERIDRSLHDVQMAALNSIMPKVYADMSLQGVSEDKLNIKSYQTIISRLKMEEVSSHSSGGLFGDSSSSSSSPSFAATGGGGGGGASGSQATGGGGSSLFGTSILSSLTSGGGGSSSSQTQAASPSNSNQANQASALPTVGGHSATPRRRFGSAHGSSPSPPVVSSASASVAQHQQTGFNSMSASQQTPNDQLEDGNIADRALQGATRMFKGFWAN